MKKTNLFPPLLYVLFIAGLFFTSACCDPLEVPTAAADCIPKTSAESGFLSTGIDINTLTVMGSAEDPVNIRLQDFETLENVQVYGKIEVEGQGVIIRNVWLSYLVPVNPYNGNDDPGAGAVNWRPGSSGMIENTDLWDLNTCSAGIWCMDAVNVFPDAGNVTVRNVYVNGFADAFKVNGGTVTVEHCFVDHLYNTETTHNDAIQVRGGTGHQISCNYLRGVRQNTCGPISGQIIWLSAELATATPITGMVIENNLIAGGFGQMGGQKAPRILGAVVQNNFFTNDHDPNGGHFASGWQNGDIVSGGTVSVWNNNLDDYGLMGQP